MRSQKYYLLLTVLLASVTIMTSCSKDYVSPLSGKIIDDITFGSELSSQKVSFEGQDLSNVTATSSEGWCQAYTSGSELIVNVIDNFTYSDRTSNIDLLDTQTNDHVTFKVTQLQYDAIIADPEVYDAPSEGGNVVVTLQKNIEKCEVLPQVDWITAVTRSYTRALTAVTIELAVANNESEKDREGEVKIKSADGDTYCIVTIRQPYSYMMTLDEFLPVGADGGEVEITIYANFDYRTEIQPTNNWIQSGTRTKLESGKYSHKFVVSALPSDKDSRRGYVYFVNGDLSFYRMLTIEQKRE